MNVAIVYDHVNRIGGAERILVALHELFPAAPLYTAVYDPQKAEWSAGYKVIPSFMQHLPFAQKKHEWYPGIPFLAFELFNFKAFDVVISVTSSEAKAIITSPNTLHICYCLTPTRYLWSHHHDYFRGIANLLTSPIISVLRVWDYYTSKRPDIYIAISQAVADRIKKYYHQNSTILYPPVDTDFFKPAQKPSGDFYLVVSRLVDYKHIELAIAACNQLGRSLKIVGTGPAAAKLKALAGSTVEFMGYLTEDALLGYYQTCRAVLFTQEEDFGIVAAEALAAGKPVIAYSKGGAAEIVSEKCGVLFYEQSVDELISAIRQFEKNVYNSNSCRRQAQKFAKHQFQKKFLKKVKEEYRIFCDSRI